MSPCSLRLSVHAEPTDFKNLRRDLEGKEDACVQFHRSQFIILHTRLSIDLAHKPLNVAASKHPHFWL